MLFAKNKINEDNNLMDDSQNGYGFELLSMFFSHFQIAEILALVVCLWCGQSSALGAKPSTILEHARFYSSAYMDKEKGLYAIIGPYLFSLVIIPLMMSILYLWNILFVSIVLYPASLLALYDWKSYRLFQMAGVGSIFFIVGLTSVSIIRVSEIKIDNT
jgi:hypothetical protein